MNPCDERHLLLLDLEMLVRHEKDGGAHGKLCLVKGSISLENFQGGLRSQ